MKYPVRLYTFPIQKIEQATLSLIFFFFFITFFGSLYFHFLKVVHQKIYLFDLILNIFLRLIFYLPFTPYFLVLRTILHDEETPEQDLSEIKEN